MNTWANTDLRKKVTCYLLTNKLNKINNLNDFNAKRVVFDLSLYFNLET